MELPINILDIKQGTKSFLSSDKKLWSFFNDDSSIFLCLTEKGIEKLKNIMKGVKDSNKEKMFLPLLQFPKALNAVAKCSEIGHIKYGKYDADYMNFIRVDNSDDVYLHACIRHLVRSKGKLDSLNQEIDTITALPHLYHALWNLMAHIESLETYKKEETNLPF